jgi:hypothetical protein
VHAVNCDLSLWPLEHELLPENIETEWELRNTFMTWSHETWIAACLEKQVYLFLSPVEVDCKGVIRNPTAHWAEDLSGTSPLSSDIMAELGLPEPSITTYRMCCRWRTRHYQALRELHQACGFDPDSDEVARFLGLPLAEYVTDPTSDWRSQILSESYQNSMSFLF